MLDFMKPAAQLRYAYRLYRSHGIAAARAIQLARQNVAKGVKHYGATKAVVVYNPRCGEPDAKDWVERRHWSDHMRWVENAEDGMRLVGFADEIDHSIRHTGWFTNEFQDETYRGVVYQLPARKGVEQYVYGYADPNNHGAAFLSFDLAHDKDDAARWADSIAEREAAQPIREN